MRAVLLERTTSKEFGLDDAAEAFALFEARMTDTVQFVPTANQQETAR